MKKQIKKNTLVNKQDISNLYKEGEVFLNYPFRIIWAQNNAGQGVRFLIAIPKKNFKKAVDRNLIKRRVKEVLKNKILPTHLQEKNINIVITYIGEQMIEFNEIEIKMMATFRKFILKYFDDEK